MNGAPMTVAIGGELALPEDCHLGEEYDLRLRCRLYGLEEDLIDVTAAGAVYTQVVTGRPSAKLVILAGSVEA